MNRRFIRGLCALIGFISYTAFIVFIVWMVSEHTVLIGDKIRVISIICRIYGLFLILVLIKNSHNYSYVLPWVMIILLSPFVGTLLYVVIR